MAKNTSVAGAFGYTGQVWFSGLGLNHYKARIYSPKLGRFLQTDPIGYKDQMNMYAYVGNDPVNKIDSTGMFTTGYMNTIRAEANLLHARQHMTVFQYTTQLEIQVNEMSSYLEVASNTLGFIAIVSAASTLEPIAGIAGIGSGVTGILAEALRVEPGSFSTAVGAEMMGRAAGNRTKPVVQVLQTVAGRTVNETSKRVANAVSETTSQVASNAFQEAAKNQKNQNNKGQAGLYDGYAVCDGEKVICK